MEVAINRTIHSGHGASASRVQLAQKSVYGWLQLWLSTTEVGTEVSLYGLHSRPPAGVMYRHEIQSTPTAKLLRVLP